MFKNQNLTEIKTENHIQEEVEGFAQYTELIKDRRYIASESERVKGRRYHSNIKKTKV